MFFTCLKYGFSEWNNLWRRALSFVDNAQKEVRGFFSKNWTTSFIRFLKVSLNQECVKMVDLVRAGKVGTVIACSNFLNPTIFAMILELFDATDTTLVLSRSIGKEHMEIVGLEEERKSERKIARQNKERSIEDEVEKLDDERKKGQNMKMNSI